MKKAYKTYYKPYKDSFDYNNKTYNYSLEQHIVNKKVVSIAQIEVFLKGIDLINEDNFSKLQDLAIEHYQSNTGALYD